MNMNPNPRKSEERFELPMAINPADIDRLGHVNNVVYLRWVQDAAVAHWKARATPEQQSAYFWVVVRHEIDYKHAARPDDGIIAQTWVGQADELTFERHTEILRASDRRVLAKAKTLWCPISAKSGRPVRVDDDVRQMFSTGVKKEE
jgi:acyl-CoA thioester hydrolase